MAPTKKHKQFVQMRQERVPSDVHKALLAHQKILNLKSDHQVTLEDASIDMWKKGIATMPHLK